MLYWQLLVGDVSPRRQCLRASSGFPCYDNVGQLSRSPLPLPSPLPPTLALHFPIFGNREIYVSVVDLECPQVCNLSLKYFKDFLS